MAVVNNFERDIKSIMNGESFPFDTASNINYLVSSLDDLTNNNYLMLGKIIKHFLDHQVPRLQALDEYSKGLNSTIYSRPKRQEENKADYRRAHNFGKIIAQFVAGYTTSVPVKYTVGDDSEQELIDTFNQYNDVATLDNELMYDVAKYGRAYELQYRDENSNNNVKLSNVFETFVIYDNTIERNPLAAVRIVEIDTLDNNQTQYSVSLYTANEIITFANITQAVGSLKVTGSTPHFYNKYKSLSIQAIVTAQVGMKM